MKKSKRRVSVVAVHTHTHTHTDSYLKKRGVEHDTSM